MTPRLREFAILTGDLSSVPSTQWAAHNCLYFLSSDLCRQLNADVTLNKTLYTYINKNQAGESTQ